MSNTMCSIVREVAKYFPSEKMSGCAVFQFSGFEIRETSNRSYIFLDLMIDISVQYFN